MRELKVKELLFETHALVILWNFCACASRLRAAAGLGFDGRPGHCQRSSGIGGRQGRD
jgi:hypothetical protein